MRRVVFWMHLSAGILASLLILFFSITGSLLAFERQILSASDHSFGHATPRPSGASSLPLQVLLSQAMSQIPSPVQTITLHADASYLLELVTDTREVYLVDPYSGRVKGPASPRLRAFFAEVTALHRWMGLGNAHHADAIVIKGATTLLLLFLIASGSILWLPKRWTSVAVLSGLQPRFHTQGRARNYNWHKVIGFWLGLPLAIIVATGVVMAYPWANALLFRLAGTPVPLRSQNGQRGQPKPERTQHLPPDIDQAFMQAVSVVGNWRTVSLRLPSSETALNFTVDQGDGGQPEKRFQVVFDPRSPKVLKRTSFADLPRGQQWRGWVRFAHTGEAGGWWSETLAFATALGATLLSITGLLLSVDRLQRSRTRHGAQ